VNEKHAINKLDEIREKEKQESAGLCGANYQTTDSDAKAAGLRDRLNMQRRRAREFARNLGALDELEYLLDTNPEIARILELLKQVGE